MAFIISLLIAMCMLLQACNTIRQDTLMTIDPLTDTDEIAPPLREVWRYNASGAFGRRVGLVADGNVLAANLKGELHLVSIERGKKLGTLSFGESISGAPVVDNELILAASTGGRRAVIGYDYIRGTRRWAVGTVDIQSGATVAANKVIAADLGGALTAYDLETGDVAWSFECDSTYGAYLSTPAVEGDTVFAVDDAGCMAALNGDDGRVIWSRNIGAAVEENIVVYAGRLYVPTTRGRFLVLDEGNGSEIWRFSVADTTVRFAEPAVVADRVVIGSSDRMVRSFSVRSGTRHWEVEGGGVFAAAPVITDGFVYIGSMDRKLYVLNTSDGQELWSTELRGRIKTAPILTDGRLIVFSEPGYIYAFAEQPSEDNESSSTR